MSDSQLPPDQPAPGQPIPPMPGQPIQPPPGQGGVPPVPPVQPGQQPVPPVQQPGQQPFPPAQPGQQPPAFPGYTPQPGYAPAQPVYNAYAPVGGMPGYTPVPQRSNGLALTSVILGVVAFIFAFIPIINYGSGIIALAGLILGIVALVQKKASKGLSLSGVIVSAVAIVLTILLAVVYTLGFVAAANKSLNDFSDSLDQLQSSDAPSSGSSSDDGSSSSSDNIHAKFDKTVVYDDGMKVSVATPTPYTPGQYSAGNDQANNLIFTVTITNGTDKDFDPTLSFATVSSGGTEGSSIIDIDNNLMGFAPSTPIPAGQSINFKLAFSVADPTQLTFDESIGYKYKDAIFQN